MARYKTEEHRLLRQEFCKQSFRRNLEEVLGNKCVNCSSSTGVQYHHIVPLVLGGTNNIGNIVPLCSVCHKKAHGGIKIHSHNNSNGRTPIISNNSEQVLNEYFTGKIGKTECAERLGIAFRTMNGATVVKRYKTQNGIVKSYNYIDVRRRFNGDNSNRETAYIVYADGNEKHFSNGNLIKKGH